jgi:hypothetical protein
VTAAQLTGFQIGARNAEAVYRARYRRFVTARSSRLPDSVARSILREWDQRYPEADVSLPSKQMRDANAFAISMVRDFGSSRVAAAYDEQRIRDHAENYAMLCACMDGLERMRGFGAGFGVEGPDRKWEKSADPERVRRGQRAEIARWQDARWWRRQLRKVWTRESEEGMRRMGIIRKGRQPYASDEAVEHRASRQRRTREWLESHVMVNDQGESMTDETGQEKNLLKLHDASLANPALRRGEFMCRMRGFEELAKQVGHVALFWTLTTPSRFHAQRSAGGINPAWEDQRARVRDGQMWLRQMWARARSQLARDGIMFYGFRVAEPHHDGTPHWHMVLFLPAESAGAMQSTLRDVWLSDMGDEEGAQQFRTKCVTIDPDKGSATGYVAKYVSKNIDGAGAVGNEISDETGEQIILRDADGKVISDSTKRVAAWAAAHGIRQFQQIGGPPVGLWREARRLRDAVAPILIETVRAAADRGKWSEFIAAMGGIDRARRRTSSVRSRLRREVRTPMVPALRLHARQWVSKCGPRVAWGKRPALPHEMPAVWLDKAEARTTDPRGRDVLASTGYGEEPAPRAAGLCSFGTLGRYVVSDTRPHRWRIEKICTGQHSSSLPLSLSKASSPEQGSDSCNAGLSSWSATLSSSRQQANGSRPGFGIDSRSRSGLGPVAITVRDGSGTPWPADCDKYMSQERDAPPARMVGPPRPISHIQQHIRDADDYRRLAWHVRHGSRQ